jgi:serine/threonine protein kinase
MHMQVTKRMVRGPHFNGWVAFKRSLAGSAVLEYEYSILRNTNKLNHPHIAKALGRCRDPETGEIQGIAFELCRGSLTETLSYSRLSNEECHSIAQQLLSAADACAQAGIVHCDIKPDNILVVDQEGSPLLGVKLADFGMATEVGHQSAGGDPTHMAPEVLCTLPGYIEADSRHDTYSIARTLLELVSPVPLMDAFVHAKHISKAVRDDTFLAAMVGLAHTRCAPQWLWLVQWGMQRDIERRPYPGQMLRYLQENTVWGADGHVTWRPETPLPPGMRLEELDASLEVRHVFLGSDVCLI